MSRVRNLTVHLVLSLALASVSALAASDAEPEPTAKGEPKLQIHGYVTQAYAIADGLQVLGITEDGTFDYRNVALQLRYDATKRNSFLLQLSHSRTGESPFQELEKDVEIDWAFFEHRFPTNTRVRVGRYPVPFGIYNQVRDVGTLLEFYRPPVSVYFEGAFTTERADGVVVSHSLGWADDVWSLDMEAYLGEWERLEAFAPFVFGVIEAEAKDGFGTQFWLNTPVQDLRFGLASQHYSLENRGFFQADPQGDPINVYLFSVEADLDRFAVHSEVYYLDLVVAGVPQIDFWAYYVQLSYRISDHVQVSVQYERSDSQVPDPAIPDISPFFEDLGASVRYSFTPHWVLRLELHQARGSLFDEFPADFILPAESDYGILSLSFSF